MIKHINKSVIFIKVNKLEEHKKILYDLLSQRLFSISHHSLPSYGDHCDFVENHPYRFWYLLLSDNVAIGTAYLTYSNSIGLFIKKEYLKLLKEIILKMVRDHTPLPGIKSIRGNYFHINVNPDDAQIINLLNQIGFKHIQSTYSNR
jgi:hypothetical protein